MRNNETARRVARRGVAAISFICVAGALSGSGLGTLSGSALAADLSLKRVMLSSVGMGYFEYTAQVTGNEDLNLGVPLDQVDDVLKSIVIVDSRGGAGTVRMPGREPLKQVFRDLPFGQNALNSPAGILNALQGAVIRAQAGSVIEGRVLRAVPETVKLPDGQGTLRRHRVSVMTDQGLKQFILEDAVSVSFTSPKLQQQVNAALAAVATHRARDRRDLKISVTGKGKGVITLGYVISVPLWKSAYRVTLPSRKSKDSARFQGWAVVDNMSGQNWNDVELTLVSGSPVTFRQALYAAYFVDRPNVPVEVMGRVLPKIDQGVIQSAEAEAKREERPGGGRADLLRDRRQARKMKQALGKSFRMRGLAGNKSMVAGMVAAAPEPSADTDGNERDRGNEVFAAASAQQGATQVVFRLPQRVSASGGQSLMVPIIDRKVSMNRVALYQPSTHALHPLATVRLANDEKTGLPPGILTLYERDEAGAVQYVGDARLGVLPSGEKRLVSYALDLRTRIDREVKNKQRIAKGKINRGVLELSLVDRQTTTYRVKAPAREDRRVMIEHRRRAGWKLVGGVAKTAEKTPTHYRIAKPFKAGAEGKMDVVLERTRLQSLKLIDLPLVTMARYAKTGELSPGIREAFKKMATLRRAIDRARNKTKDLKASRKRIFQEQKRLRENMRRVRQSTELYKRYMSKLDTQETQLERIDTRSNQARGEERQARVALDRYVSGLKL